MQISLYLFRILHKVFEQNYSGSTPFVFKYICDLKMQTMGLQLYFYVKAVLTFTICFFAIKVEKIFINIMK